MQVREVMSHQPKVLAVDATIREAAMKMRENSCGALPIEREDKLIGMLTDRDIAIRAVAEGKNPDDKVSEIMNDQVLYCFENDDVQAVLKNMDEQQVQRLIVLNNPQEKRLVGIVTLSDIADKCTDDVDSAKAIAECCRHYH